MKHDLNPRWTTTASSPVESDRSTEPTLDTRDEWTSSPEEADAARMRIPVKRSMPTLGIGILASLAGASAIGILGFVFLQGTIFLQASLTENPALDTALPVAQEETVPTRINALENASPAVDAPVPVDSIPTADVPLPTLSSVDTFPHAAKNDEATLPPSHVSIPAQVSTPLAEEILNLGSVMRSTPLPMSWPALLRTNRYTVGSTLVPDLSHVVTFQRATADRHNAATDRAPNAVSVGVHHAPATGPELTALILLSLMIAPIFLIRRRSSFGGEGVL